MKHQNIPFRFRCLYSLIVLCGAAFNPITAYSDSWQSGPSLLTGRDQFAGGVLNGNIIVFGGNEYPHGANLKSTEVLDPALGAWVYEAYNNDNGGQGIEELSGAVVNGNFYVFGGYGGGSPYGVFNFVEGYNPSNKIWTSLAPMPTTRSSATAVAYNNKIYLFGGYNDNNPGNIRTNYDVVEAYDPASNTWTTETHTPEAIGPLVLHAEAVAVVGDNAYVIGGGYIDSSGQPIGWNSNLFVYNFLARAWSTNGYTPLPNPRAFSYSSAAPVRDGKIYLIGGLEATIPPTNEWSSSKVDIYDTVSNTWITSDPLPVGISGGFPAIVSNNLWVVGGNTNVSHATAIVAAVWKYSLTLPPVILSMPQVTGGNTNFTFLLSGPAGSSFVVQVSTNLSNWSPVSTSTVPVSGSITLSNNISGSNHSFYRAYLP